MFNFEKLDTWNEAIAFTDVVYQLTQNFPAEERFGLTNQMRPYADKNIMRTCCREGQFCRVFWLRKSA